MVTRPRPSSLNRALRTLTALVTVWCLGCSAFDPLLCLLAGLPSGVGMICSGDDDAGASMAATSAAADDVSSVRATPTGDGPIGDLLCGCQSCTAPAAAAPAIAFVPSVAPRAQTAELAAPASLEREPLVPPPQLAT